MSAGTTPILDDDTVTAVREILDDPALPVGTTRTGPGGVRAATLREAIDHLASVRALAPAAGSAAESTILLGEIGSLGNDLASVLTPHIRLTRILTDLPRGRAVDAVIGDVHRGAVLTSVRATREWTWHDGHRPTPDRPLAAVDADLVLPDYPGLFDHVLIPVPEIAALVALPIHRHRITWEPLDPAATADARTEWRLHLSRVTVHIDEIIPFNGRLTSDFSEEQSQ